MSSVLPPAPPTHFKGPSHDCQRVDYVLPLSKQLSLSLLVVPPRWAEDLASLDHQNHYVDCTLGHGMINTHTIVSIMAGVLSVDDPPFGRPDASAEDAILM